jgi:hypothetical protein
MFPPVMTFFTPHFTEKSAGRSRQRLQTMVGKKQQYAVSQEDKISSSELQKLTEPMQRKSYLEKY